MAKKGLLNGIPVPKSVKKITRVGGAGGPEKLFSRKGPLSTKKLAKNVGTFAKALEKGAEAFVMDHEQSTANSYGTKNPGETKARSPKKKSKKSKNEMGWLLELPANALHGAEASADYLVKKIK